MPPNTRVIVATARVGKAGSCGKFILETLDARGESIDIGARAIHAVQKRIDLVAHRQQTQLLLQILSSVQTESLERLRCQLKAARAARPISCQADHRTGGQALFPVKIEIAEDALQALAEAASPSMSSSPH